MMPNPGRAPWLQPATGKQASRKAATAFCRDTWYRHTPPICRAHQNGECRDDARRILKNYD